MSKVLKGFNNESVAELYLWNNRGELAQLKDLVTIEEKKTALIVTHDLNIARMATRVWNIVKKDWE